MPQKETPIPTYQPSGWYYRMAISKADELDRIEDMRNLALILLDELEYHRKSIREMGHWPPVKHDPQEVTAPLLSLDPAQDDA